MGVGSRAYMYLDAIQTTYAGNAELVGVCDTNAGRLELARAHAKTAGRAEPRAYRAAEFDKMIAETKPDVVIVTTVDSTHADYICRAMELGCDVDHREADDHRRWDVPADPGHARQDGPALPGDVQLPVHAGARAR